MSAVTPNKQIDITMHVAAQISLRGRLQGMGVRPAIFRLATQLGLRGQVRNSPQGVEIHVEGSPEQTQAFKWLLPSSLPAAAQIVDTLSSDVPVAQHDRFEIGREQSRDAVVTDVPLDLAVCRQCREELHQPGNRRFQYLFNSCVQCGPRYTIIHHMPFEREDTAMVNFPWCDECYAEYHSVDNRRFHAQTISCPKCGPRLWCVTSDGLCLEDQAEVIERAAQALLHGLVVAVKGLGGYQLLVDATNPRAIQRLRHRKGRPSKPLAVMIRTLAEVEQAAWVNVAERESLISAVNPIVLLTAKCHTTIAPCVYPGLNTVGILLPTTPLHDLLLQRTGRPLVCTSGNREGEPLAFETEDAERLLVGICDLWLHHDRPIIRPIDDSVVRIINGQRVPLRLARGMAPMRLNLDATETVIALGGQLKASVAWSHGGSAFLGPHVGDLGNRAAQARYQSQVEDWQSLFRFSAAQAVHDSHPDYFTSHWAERNFPHTQAMQHHHAHVLAAMHEHGLLDQPVLGVAWDGTGYGLDHTVWGGEFIVVHRNQCRRIAHLRRFALPGGEAAIRQPWRIALALLNQSVCVNSISTLSLFESQRAHVPLLQQILKNPQFSPVTTSGGRLFDGVAALILGRQQSEYEGQLPMMLEGIADTEEKSAYQFAIKASPLVELDWRPLVRQLVEDVTANVSAARMSMKFHRAVARGIIAICRQHADLPVVLTGGVFQNRLLTELIAEMSRDYKQPIYSPERIPPGDGGLAVGQLIGALTK